MKSEIAVKRVVERTFHLHCSCGATIVTSKRAVICSKCDRTIEVRRVRKIRPHRNPLSAARVHSTLPQRQLERAAVRFAATLLLLCDLYDLLRC
jgi:hypothetical protein